MSSNTQALQEAIHTEGYDYRNGSPHLKHWSLSERLINLLRSEMQRLSDAGLPLTMLDVGAGHGSYTEPSLAFGFSVTATEMSRPSLEHIGAQYRSNPKFEAQFDPDGSLDALGDRKFSLILCASVLHHIPDYRAFLVDAAVPHLAPGGSIVCVQDPMWYPDMGRVDLLLTKLSYYAWRIRQGNLTAGLKTRVRRLRKIYDEENPADMVEYHVVRSGCDQNEIERALTPFFESVSVIPYWSAQGELWQNVGHKLRRENTFAIVAQSRVADDA